LFTAGFSFDWGSLPYLVMAEILPTRVRATASGIGIGTTAFPVTYPFYDFNLTLSHYVWNVLAVC
jgi:hypothetical protein